MREVDFGDYSYEWAPNRPPLSRAGQTAGACFRLAHAPRSIPNLLTCTLPDVSMVSATAVQILFGCLMSEPREMSAPEIRLHRSKQSVSAVSVYIYTMQSLGCGVLPGGRLVFPLIRVPVTLSVRCNTHEEQIVERSLPSQGMHTLVVFIKMKTLTCRTTLIADDCRQHDHAARWCPLLARP